MWQIAVAAMVVDGIGKMQQKKAQNRATQRQMDANYEAANKNIKSLEKQLTSAAQTQQSDVANARLQAAEARSASEIGGGVEGQSVELYKDKALRDLDKNIGASTYKFEQFNSSILEQVNEIVYNTNQQNEALESGAGGDNGMLSAVSSGLNIASAYTSGLNKQEVTDMQTDELNNLMIGDTK